jgi:tetratricopeptide (TPR) repeat protein
MSTGVDLLDQYLELNIPNPAAWNNRGGALQSLGRYEEALRSYDQAIAQNPRFTEAHNNRGIILQKKNCLDQALESYLKAIDLNPHFSEAHFNLGVIYRKMLHLEKSLNHLNIAISLKPGYADALWAKSLLMLLIGKFDEGWKLYEWGWKNKERGEPRLFLEPLWLGNQSLTGKTILIHGEQGLGDAIQFCRYMKQLSNLGANIILEIDSALISIIKTLPNISQVISRGSLIPKIDYHCPMLSLPLAFETTIDTIPKDTPYLTVDFSKAEFWKKKLGPKKKMRVGLSWFGNSKQKDDAQRSLDLSALIPLLDLPVEFHSLHKEYRMKDLTLLNATPQIINHHSDLHDFSDTAALINEMDLVISVDTALAHLSGGLNKCTVLLLQWSADWRWMLDGSNTDWYPSMSLYRQSIKGNWGGVIERLKQDLINQIELKEYF